MKGRWRLLRRHLREEGGSPPLRAEGRGARRWRARLTPAEREARRRRRLRVLPSLFTLANAVCGFAAIVQVAALRFHPEARVILNPENLVHAGWLILLGMLFDGLDGRIARFTRTTGSFGGELDSLCDAVTFGVAPAVIVAMANAKAIASPLAAKVAWLLGAAFACGAILRLARFNVENSPDDEAHVYFKGLPSPAAAGTIATLALFQGFLRSEGELVGWIERGARERIAEAITLVLPPLALVLGYLMVSRIRYVHVGNRYFRGRASPRRIAQYLFAGTAAAALPQVTLPLLFLAYAASGPVASARRRILGLPAPAHGRGGPSGAPGEKGAAVPCPAPGTLFPPSLSAPLLRADGTPGPDQSGPPATPAERSSQPAEADARARAPAEVSPSRPAPAAPAEEAATERGPAGPDRPLR